MGERGRELLGKSYEMEPVSVTEEAIQRFAKAVGETNPLFLNPETARTSPQKSLIAPPTFCFFCYPPMERLEHRFPEPGVFLGGISCELFRLLRPGDVLFGRGGIVDVFEKTGRGGRMVFTVHELLYTDRRGEKVSEVQMSWVKRLDLDENEKPGARMSGPIHLAASRSSGHLPERLLSFEDIDLGDPITPLVKEVAPDLVRQYVRMMGWEQWNLSIFTDDEMARKMGLEGAISPGELNLAFVSQLLTDWAPAGMLRRLEANFRGVVRHGDRLECRGVVTEKRVGEEGPCIECDIFAENQEGERPIVGKAIILFP